jgi:sulfide:quinone oxidoreductase
LLDSFPTPNLIGRSYTGTGGLAAANQIYNRFKTAGKRLSPGDVAIVDAAEYHYYQVRFEALTFSLFI